MPEAFDESETSSVTALLRDRAKLDDLLLREHTRLLTIFFCDIKGFTTFTETSGDIAARARIQRINDIVIPAIPQFGGQLIKTIGDAVMATFEAPQQALRFAIQVQQQLQRCNALRPEVDRIHIRIGMHLGDVILDQGDVYGDAVNVAARVEPLAMADGILISSTLYQAVQNFNEFDCRFAKKASMKGKAEPVELYQVVWDHSLVHDYSSPLTPSLPQNDQQPGQNFSARLLWAVVMLVALTVILLQLKGHKALAPTTASSDHYAMGYAALKIRDLPRASAQFQQLPPEDNRQSEAQAALSLWRQDHGKTRELVNKAMQKTGERIYVHVMQGDLLLQEGQTKEAAEEYHKALALNEGLDWHRAMAYNGLGRVQTANNQLGDAENNLAAAARLTPDDVDILTNYAFVLSRLGKEREAEVTLQKAVKVKPDDILASQLLKQLQERERLATDKVRQERINQMVQELVSQYRSKADKNKATKQGDKKLTLPSTLWLVGLEEKGDLPPREGEKEIFLDLLGQELQNSGKVQLVERQMLLQLLGELRLGSSDLADQETALSIGRLTAARVLLNGRIFRQGGQTLVNVKVIETETSKILASLSVEVKTGESLLQTASQVSGKIVDKLNEIAMN